MKKVKLLLASMLLNRCFHLAAQVAINTDRSAPEASAMLDVKSDTSGILIPRMEQTQRVAINNPATGLLVYQIDGKVGFCYNAGTPGIPE